MSNRKRKKNSNGKASVEPSTSPNVLFKPKGKGISRIAAYSPTAVIEKGDKHTSLNHYSSVYTFGEYTLDIQQRDNADPPKNAELLLSVLLHGDERDAVLGDVVERYRRLHQRLGKRRADLYAYGEVCRSLYPLIKRLIFDTGVIVLLGQWIKRLVSQ